MFWPGFRGLSGVSRDGKAFGFEEPRDRLIIMQRDSAGLVNWPPPVVGVYVVT